MNSLLVWFGGYSNRFMDSAPSDLEPVEKIGGVILFSSVFASLNWSLAAYTYAANMSDIARIAISILAGIIGFAIVVLIDRTFVFALDTMVEKKPFLTLLFAGLRLLIVFAVSSITSQALIPVLLRNELTSHALTMVEEKENARRKDLITAYNVEDIKKERGTIAAEQKRLAKVVAGKEVAVARHRQSASTCWGEYRTQKETLLDSGIPETEVLDRVSGKASVCRAHETNAKAALVEMSQLQTQYARLSGEHQKVETNLTQTLDTIKSKVDHAHEIESMALNPSSVLVLKDLIDKNKAVHMKWLLISLVVTILELLPFVVKAMMGQSTLGVKVAAERVTAQFDIEEKLRKKQEEAVIREALNEVTRQSMLEVRNYPEIKRLFVESLKRYISAMAPLEGARAMMTEIEQSQIDINGFISRYPRFATVISEAWSSAIEEAARAIRGGTTASGTTRT